MSEVTVRSEPLMYSEHSPNSFFRDLFWAQTNDDAQAVARLARHADEMRVELPARELRALVSGVEYRVNPNAMTVGQGAEFTAPLWLVDKFASAARAGRPLADLCNPMFLPPGVSSIHVPRMSTATAAGVVSDGAPVAAQDLVTTDTSSIVATIAGQLDVSQQLFEQSPGGFDAYAYLDLTRAYNRALEVQLLAGSGTGNQLLGLNNVSVPSGNSVTATGSGSTGDNTITVFWPHLGQVAANVGNNRFLPPELVLMAPRRWFWLASSVDSSFRPVASPGPAVAPAGPVEGGSAPVGRVLGLTVYADGAIPAGSSADTVYFVRPSDMFLFEGTPKFQASPNTLSGTLQTRLALHRAVAFIPHRYPSGLGFLLNIPQPTNF